MIGHDFLAMGREDLCSVTAGDLPNLVMTNTSPWKIDGPNRNRWFTYYIIAWWFSMAMLNNQMVNCLKLIGIINKNIFAGPLHPNNFSGY